MDITKRLNAILFLDRERFDFAEQGLNPVSFQFQEAVVSSLEVKSLDNLAAQIKLFAEQAQLKPANITIILSAGVVFEKDIPDDVPITDREELTQKFWDTIPFEEITSKSMKVGNAERIIAANNNLCDAIRTSFEKIGSAVEMIIPYEALGQDLWSLTALDTQNSQEILKKLDTFKQYSFDLPQLQKTTEPLITKEVLPAKKSQKIRLYIMGGVFLVLLIVLVMMLFRH